MKLPPPGRLIDIGGRRLHAQITGESGPAVVLEAGLAATSLTWALVQPQLSEFARVLSYDRAGLGWSDDAVTPPTPLPIVADLRRLLECANFPGPYILVGHSFGGLIARVFQQQYAAEMAGLVLVDPVVRSEWANPDSVRAKMLSRGAMLSRRGAFLARLGIVRFALKRLQSGSKQVPGLAARLFAGKGASVANRLVGEVGKIPRELWPAISAHWSEERAFRTMAAALEYLPEGCRQLEESRTLCDTPIVVLSAANTSPEGLAEHRRDAGLSRRGSQYVVPNTGHWISLDAPRAIVDAVHGMIRDGAR